MPFADGEFDAALAHTLLIHLRDPLAALRSIRRVLKPGGVAAISDDDNGAVVYSPHDPTMHKVSDLFMTMMRHNGANLTNSRHLRGLLLQAGFARSANGQNGGAKIEWQEGSAESLPFADGSFDVVTCQFGAMFFADRVVALKELRRVLAPGGRLALTTWGSLDKNPGNAAMAQAWKERVSPEHEAILNPPHSLSDPAEIGRLLQVAGFDQIDVKVKAGRVRFASPQALVCGYGAMSGLQADESLRDSLCADVAHSLRAYCSAEGLDYPTEGIVARACR